MILRKIGSVLNDELLDERRCGVCCGRDDHPRDVVELPGGSAFFHHFDCGVLLSPPCQHCTERIKESGDKSGEPLRKFLRGDT